MTGDRCRFVENEFTTEARRHGEGRGDRHFVKSPRRQENQRRCSCFAPSRRGVFALNFFSHSVPPCLRGEFLTLADSPNLVWGRRSSQP